MAIQTVVNELNELEAKRSKIKNELSKKYPEYSVWNNSNLFDDYIKALKAGVFCSEEWKTILIINSNIYKITEVTADIQVGVMLA